VAGSLEDERLLEAAHTLDLATLFGRFRLDRTTGRQIGHRTFLIQWQDGRKRVIWPEESAGGTLRYPLSWWSPA
jgi:hypothetical protein